MVADTAPEVPISHSGQRVHAPSVQVGSGAVGRHAQGQLRSGPLQLALGPRRIR